MKGEKNTLLTPKSFLASPFFFPFLLLPITFPDVIPAIVSRQALPSLGDSR